jgi:hypothetical protein
VFTHQLGADELADDILAANPNMDPITVPCEYKQYRPLADGSAARVVFSRSCREPHLRLIGLVSAAASFMPSRRADVVGVEVAAVWSVPAERFALSRRGPG